MRYAFLAAALTVCAASFGQNDSTRYINGLPVTEDDTARAFPQEDLGPKRNLRVVSPDKLPEKLLSTLQKEEQYRGWSDTTVYYDANTKLYMVHVSREDGVQIFGMTDKGKPVTFNQVSSSRQ